MAGEAPDQCIPGFMASRNSGSRAGGGGARKAGINPWSAVAGGGDLGGPGVDGLLDQGALGRIGGSGLLLRRGDQLVALGLGEVGEQLERMGVMWPEARAWAMLTGPMPVLSWRMPITWSLTGSMRSWS